MTRTCRDCPAPIGPRSQGRCRKCAPAAIWRDRVMPPRRDPRVDARRLMAVRDARVKTRRLTAETATLVRLLLEHHSPRSTWALLQMRVGGQAVTFRQVEHVHDERRRLARVAAAKARSVEILAAVPPAPKPQRAMLTFEEQLARVAAGASLVSTFTYRRADPAYSLVGNATGML